MATPIQMAFNNNSAPSSEVLYGDVGDEESAPSSDDLFQDHANEVRKARKNETSRNARKITPAESSPDADGDSDTNLSQEDTSAPSQRKGSILGGLRGRKGKKRTSLVDTMDEMCTELHPDEVDENGEPTLKYHIHSCCTAVIPLIQFASYVLVGYFFYHNLEVDEDGNPWSFIDCMYFAIVTCTSVGYGDLTPKRPGTKLFTCVYALVGIGLIAEILMRVVAVIYRIHQAVASRATMLMLKQSLHIKKKAAQAGASVSATAGGAGKRLLASSATAGRNKEPGLAEGFRNASKRQATAAMGASKQISESIRGSKLYTLLMIIVPLVAYIFLGLALGHIEGWDLVTSIYVACISLATVGYGDFSPQSQYGRLFASLYIPIGVAVTLNVLAQIALELARKRETKPIDLSTLLTIDTSGDGEISELEFTIYMLKALKKVDPSALEMVREKYADISGGRTTVPLAEFEELDLMVGGHEDE
jgi:hypothetical protein